MPSYFYRGSLFLDKLIFSTLRMDLLHGLFYLFFAGLVMIGEQISLKFSSILISSYFFSVSTLLFYCFLSPAVVSLSNSCNVVNFYCLLMCDTRSTPNVFSPPKTVFKANLNCFFESPLLSWGVWAVCICDGCRFLRRETVISDASFEGSSEVLKLAEVVLL